MEISSLNENRIQIVLEVFDTEDPLEHKDFAISFINKISLNYKSPEFDIVKLSKSLAMSRSQVYRHCRKTIKSSPKKILNSFRLNKAKGLIESGARINLVAEKVGFNSHSYFCRCFKLKYGCRPSEIGNVNVS